MDNARPLPLPHSSVPVLASKLDHLDLIMKHLEIKHDSTKLRRAGDERGSVSLDLDREAYFKGSLIERVATLEHRLLQLCLKIESSTSTSSGTSSQASAKTSSTNESKGDIFTSSPPTFNFSNRLPQQQSSQANEDIQAVQGDEIKEEIKETTQPKSKQSSSKKQKKGKKNTEGVKDDKANKAVGKGKNRGWSPMYLLGCS